MSICYGGVANVWYNMAGVNVVMVIRIMHEISLFWFCILFGNDKDIMTILRGVFCTTLLDYRTLTQICTDVIEHVFDK